MPAFLYVQNRHALFLYVRFYFVIDHTMPLVARGLVGFATQTFSFFIFGFFDVLVALF